MIAALQEREADVFSHPFVKTLERLFRAHDRFGVQDGMPAAAVLADFIIDREKRKNIPIIGNPDPDILDRIEMFYAAVSLRIEARTGLMAAPMMKMHPEGFGRMILTAGRLVVVDRGLRDVHRFGFPSFEKMAEEGEKLTESAVAWIEKHPEIANA